MIQNKSAVILIGKSIECLFSLRQILNSDCLVSGVVFCDQNDLISRLKSEYKRIIKYGFFLRLSQIFLSCVYILIYARDDRLFLKKCLNNFDPQELYKELDSRGISCFNTSSYHSEETLSYIKKIDPDFLVCHSPYWLDKKVRALPRDKLIIGGHPGLVPFYRGSHSAFWSIYDQCSDKNGYSIFCLDHGIDSGPLIEQEQIQYDFSISYKSNDYLLMKYISLALAKVAEQYSQGKKISSIPQAPLLQSQIRTPPGLVDFLKFQIRKISEV